MPPEPLGYQIGGLTPAELPLGDRAHRADQGAEPVIRLEQLARLHICTVENTWLFLQVPSGSSCHRARVTLHGLCVRTTELATTPRRPAGSGSSGRVLVVGQGWSSSGSRSLPFLDRSGSVHEARLKQQGRLFPLVIFEMLTSTRRLRVSVFFVALTQRTHSQRAIGVISCHRFWIFSGAATRAVARSSGTAGSGQSLVTSMSSVAVSPMPMPAACCSVSSTYIQ